jgi:hypothetical protein
MKIIGTHHDLNAALDSLVSSASASVRAAAVYFIDHDGFYATPVASANADAAHPDVLKYQDLYHRTRLSPDASRAAAFAFGGKAFEAEARSRVFQAHRLQHQRLDSPHALVQIVTDNSAGAVRADQSVLETISEIIDNIAAYKNRHALSWGAVFGLKDFAAPQWILMCDINDFSKTNSKQQAFIEYHFPQIARTLSQGTHFEMTQVIGDEVRLTYTPLEEESEADQKRAIGDFVADLTDHFDRASIAAHKTIFPFKSVAAKGIITPTFNGRYNEVNADIGYRGDVFTRAAQALKAPLIGQKNRRLDTLVFA